MEQFKMVSAFAARQHTDQCRQIQFEQVLKEISDLIYEAGDRGEYETRWEVHLEDDLHSRIVAELKACGFTVGELKTDHGDNYRIISWTGA